MTVRNEGVLKGTSLETWKMLCIFQELGSRR